MKIDPDFEEALRQSLSASQRHLAYDLEVQRDIIAQIYKGEDPSGSPPSWYRREFGETSYAPLPSVIPGTQVNLLYSSVQTLIASLFAAMPSVRAEPLTASAVQLQEDETDFLEFVFANSKIDRAIQRAIALTLFDRWAGVKRVIDKAAPVHQRTRFIPVDPGACGWEPFDERYTWCRYVKQAANLPDAWKKGLEKSERKPWDKLLITEVYLKNFGGERDKMLVFASDGKIPAAMNQQLKDPGIGVAELGPAIWQEDIKASPLAILQFAQPAAQEAVPNSEVSQWLPILQVMTCAVQKMERETRSARHMYLYDSENVDLENMVERTINGVNEIFIPVKGSPFVGPAGDVSTGVTHKLRPVERDSIMGDLVQAYLLLKNEFNEISGLSEVRRGVFPGEVQTATAVNATERGGDLRNSIRREAIADLLVDLTACVVSDQRDVYGSELVLGREGVPKTIIVPDPQEAQFALRYDAVELGHLALRGDPQANAVYLQTAIQVESQGFLGPMSADAMKRFLRGLGLKGADKMVPTPATDSNPMAKLAWWGIGRGTLDARPGENHAQFMAFYDQVIMDEESKGDNADDRLIQRLVAARRDHQILANAARPPRAQRMAPSLSGVAGMGGAGGEAIGGLAAVGAVGTAAGS